MIFVASPAFGDRSSCRRGSAELEELDVARHLSPWRAQSAAAARTACAQQYHGAFRSLSRHRDSARSKNDPNHQRFAAHEIRNDSPPSSETATSRGHARPAKFPRITAGATSKVLEASAAQARGCRSRSRRRARGQRCEIPAIWNGSMARNGPHVPRSHAARAMRRSSSTIFQCRVARANRREIHARRVSTAQAAGALRGSSRPEAVSDFSSAATHNFARPQSGAATCTGPVMCLGRRTPPTCERRARSRERRACTPRSKRPCRSPKGRLHHHRRSAAGRRTQQDRDRR